MKPIKETFAENLRLMLKAEQKTQGDLAKAVGVSQTSVSHWVNAEILPRPKTVDDICKYLGCTVDYLMADQNKEVELAPEDIIAEEIHDNPHLMRLMLNAMKLTDEQIDKLTKIAGEMK